jgi:GntR family transcriptional regulator
MARRHAMGRHGLSFDLLGFRGTQKPCGQAGIDFAHGSVPACVPRNVAAHTAAVESVPCGIYISGKSPSFDAVQNTMEFQIEKNSLVPIIKQIQAQIKLSIAMGVLKKGDILPSIREVEKQTGINRGLIHRAYLALRQFGLLSPAPGKRIAVAVSAAAPDSINKKCQELSADIIKRTRRIGVAPIAFARYLSRSIQEDERRSPFIAYVDGDREIALRRAEQISRIWHASVIGLSVDEFKLSLGRGMKIRKVLLNHLTRDSIRLVPRGRKIDIIPIEIYYTEQTIRALAKIKASSILVLLPDHAVSSAHFIVEQLHKWMKHRDAKISWITVNKVADLKQLLKDTRYDRILVSPGAWNKVPVALRRSSRIFQLQMELDSEDLEIARIRAGVIV